MVPAAQIEIHQCECESCKARTDPEMAQHHHQMNLFLSRLNEPQRRWYVGLRLVRGTHSATDLSTQRTS